MIDYVERAPSAALGPYVRKLWHLRGPRPARFEKILPQPFVHFIVNLSDPYRVVEPAQGAFAAGFVSGIQPRYVVIEDPLELLHVGVEFEPYGIGHFTTMSPARLTTAVQRSDAVLAGSAGLRQRLAGLAPPAALDELEQFVLGLRSGDPDPLVVAACRMVDADTDVEIAELARALDVGHRALIERFRQCCGITPKAYADVVRFHRFLTELPLDGPMPSWTQLVAASSYYDQSHFIHTFRRFTGFTPARYLDIVGARGRDYASFVPLGEDR